MKYGYARTSTDDQTTALQLAALRQAGCRPIHEDKGVSGAISKCPALSRCLAVPKSGDTLIVWKLDRLEVPVIDGSYRHRNPDRPRYVADDWGFGRA